MFEEMVATARADVADLTGLRLWAVVGLVGVALVWAVRPLRRLAVEIWRELGRYSAIIRPAAAETAARLLGAWGPVLRTRTGARATLLFLQQAGVLTLAAPVLDRYVIMIMAAAAVATWIGALLGRIHAAGPLVDPRDLGPASGPGAAAEPQTWTPDPVDFSALYGDGKGNRADPVLDVPGFMADIPPKEVRAMQVRVWNASGGGGVAQATKKPRAKRKAPAAAARKRSAAKVSPPRKKVPKPAGRRR